LFLSLFQNDTVEHEASAMLDALLGCEQFSKYREYEVAAGLRHFILGVQMTRRAAKLRSTEAVSCVSL
jgi:hypothetical protein